MKFPSPYTLAQIAQLIDCEFIGSSDFPVSGMNEIHVVEEGDIVFVDHPKYYGKALSSAATVVLINKKVACPKGKALLISDDPFRDFNKLTAYLRPFRSSSAQIASTASIGEGTIIQPNCFIGNHVSIGKHCIIHSNVCIYDHAVIGDHVTIHAGSVLGADAFYYKDRPEGFDKLLSGGRVILKNRVELGALCTIDKGVSGDTIIGEGSKLDNQVHVGHDTVIGKKCLIASQTGIAGCVVIEDEVTLWGQVGVVSDVRIRKGAVGYAQSGITKEVPEKTVVLGAPADEARTRLKEYASLRKLPDMLKKLRDKGVV